MSPGPVTPDGRYFVVRGRLWRMSDPALPAARRDELVRQLMDARRMLRGTPTPEARAAARRRVDQAKTALGERGPVWWTDGAPDFNRMLARNTPYAVWYAGLQADEPRQAPDDRRAQERAGPAPNECDPLDRSARKKARARRA